MADYVEFQDLKARVNTGDSSLGAYASATRILKTIDPDGVRVDYSGVLAIVEESTWLAANIPPATLKRGWWRFAAEAIDAGSKKRKTIWHKLKVLAEGEVP